MVDQITYVTLPAQYETKEPICDLHRHAHGQENPEVKVREQCMWCDDCNTTLCIKCFHLFHTVKNPTQLKAEVIQQTKITSIIKTAKAKINAAKAQKQQTPAVRTRPAVRRKLNRKRKGLT